MVRIISYMIILVLFVFNIYAEESKIPPRPEPDKVFDKISSIDLTVEQKNKIEKELSKNLKNYDSLKKNYEKKLKKLIELQKEIDEIKKKMLETNKNVTLIIKKHLNEKQLKQFEDIIKSQYKDKVNKDNVENKEKNKPEEKHEDNQSPFSIYFP